MAAEPSHQAQREAFTLLSLKNKVDFLSGCYWKNSRQKRHVAYCPPCGWDNAGVRENIQAWKSFQDSKPCPELYRMKTKEGERRG